ncbi:GIY-YIG nuclease family protein [Streptomyces ipomoeae]|uniref:GIY-YIG nuclease family protein n=1 Tax=Streptomyces ipomoeae TaxID=103232 RepID=UPI0029B01A6E|nr:GIY-YIG nuclease family protein [Streptomyces ipomoeae]MDX2697586.1 hypothetical protein [Streptomyces ipomoeae]MDX2845982.1 hypothetical protein [Streptomyces ipomoeae]
MSVAIEVTGSLPTRPAPGYTALYRFYDAVGALLYIGICSEPLKRWYTHAGKEWWPEVETFRVVWHPSRAEAERAETEAIRAERPRHNIVFNGVPYNDSRFPGARLYAMALERFGDEPFCLKDLEDELGVPKGSAQAHVRRLEGEGMIEEIGKLRTRPGRPLTHFRIVDQNREPQ